MRFRMKSCLVSALLLSGSVATAAAEVSIQKDANDYRVTAPAYTAVVGGDGCQTSLCVDGAEFLKATPTFPRGAYLYQDNILKATSVTASGPTQITAETERGTVRYEFGLDTVTWTFANRSPKTLLFVVVLDPAASVVMDAKGRGVKTPVNRPWPVTTWFRGKANLRMTGGTRIWGPWSGNHQVWQLDIPPNGTSVVNLKVNAATAEETTKAMDVATRPPPPPPTDPVGPMWDMTALSNPPKTYPAPDFVSKDAKALFYDGVPYQDRPTRVFAWVGFPPDLKPGERVPGMVLIHGGLGTAFDTWVRRWTSRGYAAISMDTCGCTPKAEKGGWSHPESGGPGGWGGWDQVDEPRTDQWTYHAVAAAILGHSLLRSLPEVDPDRIGMTGISWGGYLACIVAGVDHRLKFGVPVYGCGFTDEHGFAGSVNGLGKDRAARWMRWWDPSVYLKDATMPLLWVTGTNDFAYTFDALQKSYRLPPAPRTLCIRIRMPHGHGDAGEGPKEIFAYADSLLKGGDALVKITGQGREANQAWATFASKRQVVKAELCFTRDKGKWQDRKWEALPAQMAAPGRATATLPDGVTVYYLNLVDDRDLVVSTEHEELP